MKSLKTIAAVLTLSMGCLLNPISNAEAAPYPKKPITIVSPYGPGGAADLSARTLAAAAPEYIGKNLIVVNKAGAAGIVGSSFVAKGRKDGYTLLLARVGCQATVPAINKKIPYTWDEFSFLGMLELNPFVLTVSADSPYKTIEDLKLALQKKDHGLSYSSAGVGSLLHLGTVHFFDTIGIEPKSVAHVPFKGGGKAGAAVVGGHVDMFFQNLSGVIGHIKSGKLRALAVTTPERAELIPNVPTFSELGYEEMEVIIGWSALYGPKGLKKDVTDKWTETLASVAKDDKWIQANKDLGNIPMVMSSADTKAFVEKQYTTLSVLVDKLGLTIQ